ncbi:MAG: PorT family protein [Dysgonamonadaceae bacterium]|jgi:hypothetical protein|nr:PorT family protein [Dysgonamonadaceae bacterium]
MKKRIVLALMNLLLGFPLFSQVTIQLDSLAPPPKPFQPEWAFGVNGGVTLSKVGFNPTVAQTTLLQYAGGITARYISERNVGLQLELNYSLRGWKEKTDSVNIYRTTPVSPVPTPDDPIRYTNYSRSLAYLELPILTHIYFNMGKRMRIIFLMGPQISYYLNEKVLESERVIDRSSINSTYYDQKVQRIFDYGILGGMGFELRTGIGSFVLDGRYYFGLSDVFSSHKADPFQASSNQIINIKLSYLFKK